MDKLQLNEDNILFLAEKLADRFEIPLIGEKSERIAFQTGILLLGIAFKEAFHESIAPYLFGEKSFPEKIFKTFEPQMREQLHKNGIPKVLSNILINSIGIYLTSKQFEKWA